MRSGLQSRTVSDEHPTVPFTSLQKRISQCFPNLERKEAKLGVHLQTEELMMTFIEKSFQELQKVRGQLSSAHWS